MLEAQHVRVLPLFGTVPPLQPGAIGSRLVLRDVAASLVLQVVGESVLPPCFSLSERRLAVSPTMM